MGFSVYSFLLSWAWASTNKTHHYLYIAKLILILQTINQSFVNHVPIYIKRNIQIPDSVPRSKEDAWLKATTSNEQSFCLWWLHSLKVNKALQSLKYMEMCQLMHRELFILIGKKKCYCQWVNIYLICYESIKIKQNLLLYPV